jgi:outer membrane protein assembly factor BamB
MRPVRAVGNRLYFGACGGGVYCLDSSTGRAVWSVNVGSDVISEVAVGEGRAYLGTADGRVLALDANSGRPVWEYRTGGPIQGSPALGDGAVLIGSGDCSFYAVDARTGRLRWKREMERMNQSLPIYMNGTVYFGAWDKYFHALNTQDGSVRWEVKTGETLYFSPANSDPATDGRRIIVGMSPLNPGDSDILCFDALSGEYAWKVRSPDEKSYCALSNPCIDGDRFYIAAMNGTVHCMSLEVGKPIWQASAGGPVCENSPVAAHGRVYIGTIRSKLCCFDAGTGDKEWEYSLGAGHTFASPTISGDLVIVPSVGGWITALKAE